MWKVKDENDLVVLEKGSEKINIRNFDSSGTNGFYPGYTHQMTIDVLKYDIQGSKISSQEVKFILPQ